MVVSEYSVWIWASTYLCSEDYWWLARPQSFWIQYTCMDMYSYEVHTKLSHNLILHPWHRHVLTQVWLPLLILQLHDFSTYYLLVKGWLMYSVYYWHLENKAPSYCALLHTAPCLELLYISMTFYLLVSIMISDPGLLLLHPVLVMAWEDMSGIYCTSISLLLYY